MIVLLDFASKVYNIFMGTEGDLGETSIAETSAPNPRSGMLSFYLQDLEFPPNGQDQPSREEIEREVQAKLDTVHNALAGRKKVSIPLWGYHVDASHINAGLGRWDGSPTDLRTIKSFPEVVDSPLLSTAAFVEIIRKLGVREGQFQKPEFPKGAGFEGYYLTNKVVPAKDRRVYFHLIEDSLPYTSYAIAFLTTNVDYHRKVPPRVGEKPKGLIKPLLRR